MWNSLLNCLVRQELQAWQRSSVRSQQCHRPADEEEDEAATQYMMPITL